MDSVSRPAEHIAEADGGSEMDFDFGRKFEAKTRKCLMCGETFESQWAGERVCKSCKSTAAWRAG